MKEPRYYSAQKLFTGKQWHENATLVVEEGFVKEIIPTVKLACPPAQVHPVIAPALIDLQIYGAGGKLLSMFPDARSLEVLYQYCKSGGAHWFQPTVATNSRKVIFACIDAVRSYREQGGLGCIGLHIEGPWINEVKKGAHLPVFIHSPSPEEAKEVLEYGKGIITMITVAPEVCSREVIDLIRSYGVVLSAGHTNATYEEATKAFDEGIPAATHLYNAMSPLQHRAPGVVGAVFNHSMVRSSIVPDGYHVDFAAIKIAKKQLGERLFAITDAVTETTDGPYQHRLNGDRYEANGVLSGSALTMLKCVQNFVQRVGIESGEALRMCSLYPAQLMQKPGMTGLLEPAHTADIIAMDEQFGIAISL
ncbi:MAG TPA: N-acetylglucosamine-6-phosphate deacetylase [Sediminibacterium sp.]|nr:N-acetylglucosamine-6-phosphate deacetylase [Sediminibacterium sp.]